MTISGGTLPSNISLSYGLDADKPENPKESNVYVATDSKIMYICYDAGTWENASPDIPIMNEERTEILQDYGITTNVLITKSANVGITLTNSKTHEIVLSDDFNIPDGTMRFTLSHFCDTYPTVTYTIVVNGEVLKTASYGSSSGGRQTKTLDVDGIKAGDTVELWAVKNQNYTANVQDFKLLGAFTEPIASPSFS